MSKTDDTGVVAEPQHQHDEQLCKRADLRTVGVTLSTVQRFTSPEDSVIKVLNTNSNPEKEVSEVLVGSVDQGNVDPGVVELTPDSRPDIGDELWGISDIVEEEIEYWIEVESDDSEDRENAIDSAGVDSTPTTNTDTPAQENMGSNDETTYKKATREVITSFEIYIKPIVFLNGSDDQPVDIPKKTHRPRELDAKVTFKQDSTVDDFEAYWKKQLQDWVVAVKQELANKVTLNPDPVWDVDEMSVTVEYN